MLDCNMYGIICLYCEKHRVQQIGCGFDVAFFFNISIQAMIN